MNPPAPRVCNPRGALLCALLIATTCPAWAKFPASLVPRAPVEQSAPAGGDQRCVGTVGQVDQHGRFLRIQRYGAVLPMNLTWNSRTSFLSGARTVSAAQLERGALVTVWYHAPLIGKRVASKIVIGNKAAPAKLSPQRRAD